MRLKVIKVEAHCLVLADESRADEWGKALTVLLDGKDFGSDFTVGDEVELVARKVVPTPDEGQG